MDDNTQDPKDFCEWLEKTDRRLFLHYMTFNILEEWIAYYHGNHVIESIDPITFDIDRAILQRWPDITTLQLPIFRGKLSKYLSESAIASKYMRYSQPDWINR